MGKKSKEHYSKQNIVDIHTNTMRSVLCTLRYGHDLQATLSVFHRNLANHYKYILITFFPLPSKNTFVLI